MQQQHGRRHGGGVGDRRHLEILVQRVHPASAPLNLAEADPDVGRPVHARQVRDGRSDDRGFEARLVPDNPRSHVAAVAVARDSQARFVDVRPSRHLVDGRHDVAVILAAPVSEHRLDEVDAVAAGAARVDGQHDVARRRQHLLDRVEGVVEGALGATVNVQHHRVLAGRVEARREHDPGLDLHAAAVRG